MFRRFSLTVESTVEDDEISTPTFDDSVFDDVSVVASCRFTIVVSGADSVIYRLS